MQRERVRMRYPLRSLFQSPKNHRQTWRWDSSWPWSLIEFCSDDTVGQNMLHRSHHHDACVIPHLHFKAVKVLKMPCWAISLYCTFTRLNLPLSTFWLAFCHNNRKRSPIETSLVVLSPKERGREWGLFFIASWRWDNSKSRCRDRRQIVWKCSGQSCRCKCCGCWPGQYRGTTRPRCHLCRPTQVTSSCSEIIQTLVGGTRRCSEYKYFFCFSRIFALILKYYFAVPELSKSVF